MPKFLHPCVRSLCIPQLLRIQERSLRIIQLFLSSPSHLLLRLNWDRLSPAASASQHSRGQDSREQAELEGHCHQPLTPCHGRAPALLISLYFPLQCICFYIILCLQCFPPLTGSRAVTQHPTPGSEHLIPFTDMGSISAQFIVLYEKTSSSSLKKKNPKHFCHSHL